MSILDQLPDRCSIFIRQQSVDLSSNKLGAQVDDPDLVSSLVECWMQPANAKEIREYEKRGQSISHKIYFTTDPNVTELNTIKVTHRNGSAVSNPQTLDVIAVPDPDATAGVGFLFKVMTNYTTG